MKNEEIKMTFTQKITRDEMKNKISMALKDPILQQGFEIICKENAELRKKIGIYQKGMYDEIEKRDRKLTKAKDLLLRFTELKNKPCASGHSVNMLLYENICVEAEQFLKGERQDKWVNPVTTTNDPFVR